MTYRNLLALVLLALLSCHAVADAVALNPDHPQRYAVVKGDTLWDISARFLRDPWLWPEVWQANPQIENPHLIYPGDIVSLVYINGKPRLILERGGISATGSDLQVVKLSPMARPEKLERAIPTIPYDKVAQFLNQPLVVDRDELPGLPYIVENADEHLVTGAGDRIYVRAITDTANSDFNVFRPGEVLRDPDTGEVLGYEALHIGDAALQRQGDPATLLLTSTTREAAIGDRVRPVDAQPHALNFLPRAPEQEIRGRIISVVDGVTQIGSYQVVVLNRGAREGIEVGHVLEIHQAGKTVRDIVKKGINATVTLPDERAGTLMVFRIFDKVSYALVMKATRPIHVLDTVSNPA